MSPWPTGIYPPHLSWLIEMAQDMREQPSCDEDLLRSTWRLIIREAAVRR